MMNEKRGYLLLAVILFISVVALSGTVGVFEQDTRLKRFQERDLKANLDAIRRAVDLYRFKFTVTEDTPSKIQALEDKLKNGPASEVLQLLAAESFLRARLATGSMRWKQVKNLVQNPSFELDSGTADPNQYVVDTWHGNATPNDDVPDGWELTPTGAFQKISLATATYVASFWSRSSASTAGVKMKLGPDSGAAVPTLVITANDTTWKRHYATFVVPVATTTKLEFEQVCTNSGETVNIDGVMLELWNPPAGAPASLTPVPSAWTASSTITINLASATLQQANLDALMASDTTPASISWWLEW